MLIFGTQIWFQNRRQMTRRKSRPLLPHEVFSSLQSSQEDAGHTSSSNFTSHESSQQQPSSSQSTACPCQSTVSSLETVRQEKALAEPVVNESAPSSEIPGNRGSNNITQSPGKISESSANPTTDTSASFNTVNICQPSITSLIRSLSQAPPTKRRPGYLANRRSASFVIHDDTTKSHSPSLQVSSLVSIGPAKGASDASESAQPLKRTSSHVRLSMSLEGKAEVITRTGNTPSPPRSQPVPTISNLGPRANTGLQRSYSALEPGNKSLSDNIPGPYSRRSMTGRSRDARTWEFYCDSDARNALTEQAEREESGSATAAIGLIRSCSNSKVMNPNPNKRNAHSQKAESTKRLKADFQKTGKPKLARATSSVARLQTANVNGQTQRAMNIKEKKLKGASETAIWQEYEGDSDKENWEPGTQSSNSRGRRTGRSHQAARILEESLRIPGKASGVDAMMNGEDTISRGNSSRRSMTKSYSGEEKENIGPEVDGEIAEFMGETGRREVEDLDCVQSLLSLSQAAWQ